MNSALLILISFIPLGVLSVSDFRKRRISVYWLLVFAGSAFFSAGVYLGWETFIARLAVNFIFLAGLYLVLAGYVYLFRRRVFHSFSGTIGLGDLLFLPLLSPFFELYGFVLFLTAAFASSLLGYGIVRLAGKTKKSTTVPLVGTVGICFMFYMLGRLWGK